MINTQKTVVTNLGDKLELKCECQGCLPVTNVQWTFKPKSKKNILSDFVTEMDEERDFFVTTLTVDPVKLTDHGIYDCELKNKVAKKNSKIDVQVHNKPFGIAISLAGREVISTANITEFRDHHLICTAVAFPLADFIWMRNGIEVSRQSKMNNLTLKADEMATSQGKYECLVRNSVGEASKEVFLLISIPPSIRDSKTQSLAGAENEKIFLDCEVTGVPEPKVSWLFNSQPLKPDSRYSLLDSSKTLVLTMSADLSGMYTCFAMNEAGDASKSFEISFKGEKISCLKIEKFHRKSFFNRITANGESAR